MSDRRNDEEPQFGWDELRMPPMPNRSEIRPTKRLKSRRARRLDVAAAVLASLLTLAVTLFLTLLLIPAALPLVAQDLATPTTAPAVATYEAALTPTSADWYTLQNSGVGFQVDIPGVISSSHAYFINDFSGMGSDFYYNGAPLSSPLQQREAPLWVKVLYSTKIADFDICPQGGAAVTLGSGKIRIQGWQRNEGRIVALNLVLNGAAIEIDLDSRDDTQPALTYYGDIWQHMLASFEPLQSTQRHTTRPCG